MKIRLNKTSYLEHWLKLKGLFDNGGYIISLLLSCLSFVSFLVAVYIVHYDYLIDKIVLNILFYIDVL